MKEIRVLVFGDSFRLRGSEHQAIEIVKRVLKRHLIIVIQGQY